MQAITHLLARKVFENDKCFICDKIIDHDLFKVIKYESKPCLVI